MRVLVGLILVTASAVLPNACASPTTILLDIRTSPELCTGGSLRLASVGIAVSTEARIDDPDRAPLTVFANGCANRSRGTVGTLVITPSGEPTAEVAVRVVAGFNDNSASDCDLEDGKSAKNCIITKRRARFREGEQVPLTVVLELDCNGVQCPDGLVCVRGGTCAAPEAIPNTPNEVPDANVIEDAVGLAEKEPEKDAGKAP